MLPAEVAVSDAEGPAKDFTSNKVGLRADSTALHSINSDATRDTPASPVLNAPQTDRSAPEPKSIGHYRLVQKLGEGGMGQVWLAEQTAPVRRQVALKLIKAGMCDDAMLHRFQSERQSLAIMDHPSIAKVFDAGATPDGQPYFVMEYVPGWPITGYCDQQKLNIRERLGLLMQACEGVQHAHQKAIIHRDLKPANVLVVEVDGKLMPRIIDFGLAKAATPHAFGEITLTQVGAPVGTPAYMSPEQADPEVRDVDTRTDVYSLGVLLYELLTGTLPFDPKQWQGKPLNYVLRRLREEDPPRPSTQFNKRTNTDREATTAVADMRGTDPKRLLKLLRGDLDWITMKALEKDRARRYGTPSELASDIGRYLENQPVMARPASVGYRLEKYARRHRIGVSAAAGLVLLLTGFIVTQAVELRRITQERDRTTRERDRANRITDFTTGMFKVSDPGEARGSSITAREILDKASKDINASLTNDPELQAQMMYVMGKVYKNLGLYSQAQALLEHAVDTNRRVLGAEHPDTLRSMSELSWTIQREGRSNDAEKFFRETLEGQRRVLGPENSDTLRTMGGLAWVLQEEGRYTEAESLQRQMLETQRRLAGPEGHGTLSSMTNLASTLTREGQYTEAEKLVREVIDIKQRVDGPDHPNTLMAMSNLVAILGYEGLYAESEKVVRQTLDIQRRVLGPEHPDTLMAMNNLAVTLGYEGRYVEAEKLMKQTLDIQRRILGPHHPLTVRSIYDLGGLAARQGKRDEALSLLREAVDHGLPHDLSIDKDPDLKSLHGDPRFAALVAHAKERAEAAQ